MLIYFFIQTSNVNLFIYDHLERSNVFVFSFLYVRIFIPLMKGTWLTWLWNIQWKKKHLWNKTKKGRWHLTRWRKTHNYEVKSTFAMFMHMQSLD